MHTIGEFAALGRVSARMLRHYDALGLLSPAHVDDVTGYRYYDTAQVRRLNQLLAFRDLGYSLAEVGRLSQTTRRPRRPNGSSPRGATSCGDGSGTTGTGSPRWRRDSRCSRGWGRRRA